MNIIKNKKNIILLCIYIGISIAFFLIGGKQLKYIEREFSPIDAIGVLPETTELTRIEQTFYTSMDEIDSLKLKVATYARENQGNLFLTLKNGKTGNILAEKIVDVIDLKDNEDYEWIFERPLTVAKNDSYVLTVTSDSKAGYSITFYYGSDKTNETGPLELNGAEFQGNLYMIINGSTYSLFGSYYWQWVFLGGVIILLYFLWIEYNKSRQKITRGMMVFIVWKKYKFLIQQLVSRDFKIKYKRSVLGYCWSFLNPLLTMVVQYIVFSTIFRSGIDNYPVYLLSGIILFSFFTDAVGQGLMAIVANSSLITKVYVPKYIYPISKVASSSVNLFISIIPLLLVVLLTGQKITFAILLLPFVLICLLLFCMGMTLALSSAMVYFRDTQYLWGIFSMIWMYATPLFYPESIIPAKFRLIQSLNPMYHMIKFIRIILIDGVSPEPMLYANCIIGAFVTCLIGAYIFKKSQNSFILYI